MRLLSRDGEKEGAGAMWSRDGEGLAKMMRELMERDICTIIDESCVR